MFVQKLLPKLLLKVVFSIMLFKYSFKDLFQKLCSKICFNYVAIQEMEISFQYGSSEAYINSMREKLLAWTGCDYNILDRDELREATLPSV